MYFTLKLHYKLWPKINIEYNLKKIFQEIDMPLISILSNIETHGVLIDKNILTTYSLELTNRINKLKDVACQLVNEKFNISSIKELRNILYCKYNIPILEKTPNGLPSTSEKVLTKLASKYPIIKVILEYRSLSKLKSTYVDKLPKMVNSISKRIHTTYHQTTTTTGRISSSIPNLQNIPVRNHDGKRIRKAFIVPSKYLMLSADYSQIELRILAHISKDKKLLKAFFLQQDIHTTIASEIFVTSPNKITNLQRRHAKIINFGLIYGMSVFNLAKQLSTTYKEAYNYMNTYFKRYPGIKKYMQKTYDTANKHGYVVTLEGRKLYIQDIHSTNKTKKTNAERTAINAPIQGTAADIIKKAMIDVGNWLNIKQLPIHIIIQVHDELIFEIHKDIIDQATTKIKTLMENCYKLLVPLKVNIKTGKNWEQIG